MLVKPNKYFGARIYRYPEDAKFLSYPMHWHLSYEFIYVRKGSLKISKLDAGAVIKKDDVYFLNSQEIHNYNEISQDAEFIVVNFLPKAILPYLDNPHIIPTFKIPDGIAREMITKSLSAIYNYENFDDKLTSMRIRAILYNSCYYLLRDCLDESITYIKGSESGDYDCARAALVYIEENYHKDITLNDISSYVGMTPAHFSKYFKDKNGETFSKCLRRIRLEHAIDDLKNNGYTVKAAAEKNGFPNVNSLIGTCKAEYGHTPIEIKNFHDQF